MSQTFRKKIKQGFHLFLLTYITLLFVLTSSSAADQERIPTMISISLDPAVPQTGEGFYITGTLISAIGDPLGNKWVVLQSTAAGATPGKFQYLTVTRTERDGTYSFFRPASSPPEELKVTFKGLYPFAPSESEIVAAKE